LCGDEHRNELRAGVFHRIYHKVSVSHMCLVSSFRRVGREKVKDKSTVCLRHDHDVRNARSDATVKSEKANGEMRPFSDARGYFVEVAAKWGAMCGAVLGLASWLVGENFPTDFH